MGAGGRVTLVYLDSSCLRRTQAQGSSCQLADARRVSVRPAQALGQPKAVGSLEGATQAHAATQNHRLLNQLFLHSPQSFALHASHEPHRAALADLAAALLCGFAGGATSSSSSVGSTSSALACSSALRLSTFAGDRPLCLESTFCQNSSNSRSVINWLHSRLRDSMLARGAHQTPTCASDRLSALRTAWTEMTNNRSFAVRRRCLEIAVISLLDIQRTDSRSPSAAGAWKEEEEHRAFVLGLGARHRGIVDLSDSEGVIRCVTVFACYSSSS